MKLKKLRTGFCFGIVLIIFRFFMPDGAVLAVSDGLGQQYFLDAKELFRQGQYFKAARYAFAAKNSGIEGLQDEAGALVAVSLIRAGLFQSASYFFIDTLESRNRLAIRLVLKETEVLLARIGPDLFRKYLLRNTVREDFDLKNSQALEYVFGKEALLSGEYHRAVGYLSRISEDSILWPYSLQMRGTAHAILGKNEQARAHFEKCREATRSQEKWRMSGGEAEDLEARCQAGMARVHYQSGEFEAADRSYDKILKASVVWPEILFEQAWTAYAQKEMNRTLGKLVSYKSPILSFVFNPEVDVLRAQAYLGLCYYSDVKNVVDQFLESYQGLGESVKNIITENDSKLGSFYYLGKKGFLSHPDNLALLPRLIRRLTRNPYFKNFLRSEADVLREKRMIEEFDRLQPGVDHHRGHGFPGFLNEVLQWRIRTVEMLGGVFVKNSLLDYYSDIISNFEKISFIKIEMLKLAKDQILKKIPRRAENSEGSEDNMIPERKDYQYYWGFNGEFWLDELGDYIFGLESQCK